MTIDPPWRFDPHQNPKEVVWGGYYVLFQLFASNVLGGNNTAGPNNHVVTFSLKNGAMMAHERNENKESGGVSFYEGIFLIDVSIPPQTDEDGNPIPNAGEFVTFKTGGNIYSEPDPEPPETVCARYLGTGERIRLTDGFVFYAGVPFDLYDSAQFTAIQNAGQDALTAYLRTFDPTIVQQPHYSDDGVNFVWKRFSGSEDPHDWVLIRDQDFQPIKCNGKSPPPQPPGSPSSPFYLSTTISIYLYSKSGNKVQASDKYFPIRSTSGGEAKELLVVEMGHVTDGEATFAISAEKAFKAEDTTLPFVYPSKPVAGEPSPGVMNPTPYSITGFRRSAEDPLEDTQWGLHTGYVAVSGPPSPGPN